MSIFSRILPLIEEHPAITTLVVGGIGLIATIAIASRGAGGTTQPSSTSAPVTPPVTSTGSGGGGAASSSDPSQFIASLQTSIATALTSQGNATAQAIQASNDANAPQFAALANGQNSIATSTSAQFGSIASTLQKLSDSVQSQINSIAGSQSQNIKSVQDQLASVSTTLNADQAQINTLGSGLQSVRGSIQPVIQPSTPNYQAPAPSYQPPAPSYQAPAPSGGQGYTVQSGDWLSAIAQRYGISLSAIENANPQISNPNLIRPGQVVTIPGGASVNNNQPSNKPVYYNPVYTQPASTTEGAISNI